MFLRVLVLVWSLSCSGATDLNWSFSEWYRLRLVDGDGRCRGELQFLRRGRQEWNAVRAGHVSLQFGHRLCAELDCGAALSLQEKRASVRDVVSLSPDACEDTTLRDCFGYEVYRSKTTLELNCSEPLRLVEGASRCEGIVELKHRGEWRRVRVPYDTLSMSATGALCRGMGCGSARSSSEILKYDDSDVWFITNDCVARMAFVRDCVTRPFVGRDSGLRIECSENQNSRQTRHAASTEDTRTLFST